MPFDTADPADTFPSDDPSSASDGPPTKAYPAPPPLAPLSSLLGYTPADLTRYTTAQHAATSRLLSLPLTPTEQHALAYYDSIFYTYESYGDTLGSAAGALLGSALSLRPPGRIPAAVARALRLPPRAVATVLRITIFASLGRLYGLTTAGVQALARMRAEQQRDPAMVRVVAARAGKAAALERELRARVGRGERGVADGGDAHSLGGGGGGGMAELRGRSDEDVVSDEREAFPFGRPSEAVAAQMEGREGRTDGEDPFLVVEGEGEAGREAVRGAPVRGGWRNNHSATGESTWERLRRGQLPRQQTRQGGDEEEGVQPQQPSSSPWPQRAPMKGFGGAAAAGGGEPKTDSFSFSRTTEERELAKAQAQKEFDESVERERRSASGDGYSEGDQGGRAAGRW